MNNQFIFDVVYTHLMKQQQRSTSDEGGCYYKIDSLMCAIGCLIPDNLYKEEMEGKSVEDLLTDHKGLAKYIKPQTIDLLAELQTVHDKRPVSMWKKELEYIAIDFKLEIPEL